MPDTGACGVTHLKARQAKAHRTSFVIFVLAIALVGTSCLHESRTQTAPSEATHKAFPQQIGLINDFADVFDPAEEQRLNQLVSDLRAIQVDFPIVTIDTTNGESLYDYSLALARDWRPGGPSKRGLLLVLAIKDRQWRLQVSEALRSALPDELCLELGRQSEDLYKQRRYADGVEHYVRALADRLRNL